MKKHFYIACLACILCATVIIHDIWNWPKYASLGIAIFGPRVGPVFDLGIWAFLFTANGIWAIKEYKALGS